MITSNRSFQISHPSMIELDKARVPRLEPIMLPEIRLHRLGSMVRSEHLRGQTLRRLSQEPVHRLRSYPVEDQVRKLLSICELVKVSSNRTIGTVNPQDL